MGNDASVFRVPAGVLLKRVDEDLVIVDLEKGFYYSLDEVGANALELLQAGGDLPEACARLSEVYEVDLAQVTRDVEELVGDMLEAGLLETVGDV